MSWQRWQQSWVRSDSQWCTNLLENCRTALTQGYTEATVNSYTQSNKLHHLHWDCGWQVGKGFCPITERKGWSWIKRTTRSSLMRTWYDCCGTQLCPQHSYSIGTEWPELSSRASDRDTEGGREIMEVRRIDSSLNVRVCGRIWDAATKSGKEIDAQK